MPHVKGAAFRFVQTNRIGDRSTSFLYLRIDESPRLKNSLVFDTRTFTESFGSISVDTRSNKVRLIGPDNVRSEWIVPAEGSVAARIVTLVGDEHKKGVPQKTGKSGRTWHLVAVDSEVDHYGDFGAITSGNDIISIPCLQLKSISTLVYMRPEARLFAPCDYDHWGKHEPIKYRPMRSGKAEDKILRLAKEVGLLDK